MSVVFRSLLDWICPYLAAGVQQDFLDGGIDRAGDDFLKFRQYFPGGI